MRSYETITSRAHQTVGPVLGTSFKVDAEGAPASAGPVTPAAPPSVPGPRKTRNQAAARPTRTVWRNTPEPASPRVSAVASSAASLQLYCAPPESEIAELKGKARKRANERVATRTRAAYTPRGDAKGETATIVRGDALSEAERRVEEAGGGLPAVVLLSGTLAPALP